VVRSHFCGWKVPQRLRNGKIFFGIPHTWTAVSPVDAAVADLLLGITFNGNPNSALVSVDPTTAAITQTHLMLNPREYFTGITYDRNHHRLYVLGQLPRNLYAIDTRTLAVKHLGNLRLDDPDRTTYQDAEPLAYDPVSNTLYCVVRQWFDVPDTVSSCGSSGVPPVKLKSIVE